jgi:hypothetical protein
LGVVREEQIRWAQQVEIHNAVNELAPVVLALGQAGHPVVLHVQMLPQILLHSYAE